MNKIISEALQNAKDFIPWQKEVNAMLDFGNELADAWKKVASDIWQWAKQAFFNWAKAIDENPFAKATANNWQKLVDTFSPTMFKTIKDNKASWMSRSDAFSNAWSNSWLMDKMEVVLSFTPWKTLGKWFSTAYDALKAWKELTTKQLQAAEKVFSKHLNTVQKNALKQLESTAETIDDTAKEVINEVADDATKLSDELAESWLDFSKTQKSDSDKLSKLGFDSEANMSKATKETIETTKQKPIKLDVAKLKEQWKADTAKELEAAAAEIKDPIAKAKVEEAIKKNPEAVLKWFKNPKVLKKLWITAATLTTLWWAWSYVLSSDSDQKEIDNIINENKTPPMSKASSEVTPDKTTQAKTSSETPLTLETTKLPWGKLPHQVVSQEMGLSWQKNRDKIDAWLAELGIDLSKVWPVWSAARNIAMANYIVQLKTKAPDKFEKLQQNIYNPEV